MKAFKEKELNLVCHSINIDILNDENGNDS
jgi:hypothetical protein